MPNVVRDADKELLALKRVERALVGLSPNQSNRVLRFAWDRLSERTALTTGPQPSEAKDVTPEEGS